MRRTESYLAAAWLTWMLVFVAPLAIRSWEWLPGLAYLVLNANWPILFFPVFLAGLRSLEERGIREPRSLILGLSVVGIPLGLVFLIGTLLVGLGGNLASGFMLLGLLFLAATIATGAVLGWLRSREGSSAPPLPRLGVQVTGLVGASIGWSLGYWGMLLLNFLTRNAGNLSGLAEIFLWGLPMTVVGGFVGSVVGARRASSDPREAPLSTGDLSDFTLPEQPAIPPTTGYAAKPRGNRSLRAGLFVLGWGLAAAVVVGSGVRFWAHGQQRMAYFSSAFRRTQDPQQRQAAEALTRVGGHVNVDDTLPGSPPVVVRFSQDPVTDTDLAPIAALPRLRTLILNQTPITDRGLEHLRGLQDLEELSLMATPVRGRGLAHLTRLPRLRSLLLGASAITDSGLEPVGRLEHLRELGLFSTRISDAGLAHLGNLRNLEKLDLTGTLISDEGLRHFHGLKRLREIRLAGTRVSNDGVAALRRALPRVRVDQRGMRGSRR